MRRKAKVIIVKSIFNSLILGSLLFLAASFGPFLNYEVEYKVFNLTGKKYVIDQKKGDSHNTLVQAIFSPKKEISISPQDADFDIIIPKIGINERIIANVNSTNPLDVTRSLRIGVGMAKGTSFPDQNGNMYLFAHSSVNILSIDRYNAVFTLLRDLNTGDLIYIFYKGKEYTYSVYGRKTVSAEDTKDITFVSPFPEITLQTCDPPGFNINRLLIKARKI